MIFAGRRSSFFLLLASLCLAASAGRSLADEYHYNSTIIGDRASGMGGAYTAVSDEAAGLYYNPAGIVYSQGTNLSASANAYSTVTKTYEGALGAYNYVRQSQTIQPNFFGVVQHTQFGTVGFSYAIPDSILESQDQTFANPVPGISSYTLNFNKDYNLYNAGPSYAADINDDLKAGITLYFHYKRQKTITNQIRLWSDSTATAQHVSSTNDYAKLEEYGIKPVLGVLWSPKNGKFSLGVSFSQTYLYNASEYLQNTQVNKDGTASTGASNFSTVPNYPYTVRIGGAWFPSPALLIAADIVYNSAASNSQIVYGDKVAVVNYSLGAEYYPFQSFAIRAGVFTDNANVPNVSLDPSSPLDKVNLVGFSLSGTWFAKSTTISGGVTTSFGNGQQAIGADSSGNPIIGGIREQNVVVFIGTSYSY